MVKQTDVAAQRQANRRDRARGRRVETEDSMALAIFIDAHAVAATSRHGRCAPRSTA